MTSAHLARLLGSLVQLDARDLDELVVFGSAAIALNGVNLGRPVKDLDLFVSSATFERLGNTFPVQFKAASEGGQVPFIAPFEGLPIEILASFPGVQFADVYGRARPTNASEGRRVGALEDLRRWKVAQGREKDREDIKAIDKHVTKP
jgi:hypothetical protein